MIITCVAAVEPLSAGEEAKKNIFSITVQNTILVTYSHAIHIKKKKTSTIFCIREITLNAVKFHVG